MANKNVFSKANQRHSDLLKRSFEHNFDLLLLEEILKLNSEDINITIEQAKDFFNRTDKDEIIENNRKSWQKSKNDEPILDDDKYKNLKVGDVNDKLKGWYKSEPNMELFKVLKTWYKENLFITKEEFQKIYGQDEDDRTCGYCGITEKQIHKLIDNDKILTKRLYSRGRSFEVDKKEPNKDYTEDNIVLSCYWCNNAKTDEFSYKEFKETIGKAIKQVWLERLK